MIYLKTNIAKYLPGNVWHFYGRVRALQTSGSSTGAAILGVVLEPVLMAAAALGLAAISFSVTAVNDWRFLIVAIAALVAMLVAIHPRFLNPVLQKLGKAKAKSQGLTVIISTLRLQSYPWSSLLGELGFVVLRGIGFVITLAALQTLQPNQILLIMGAFSLAWLSGLVVPGAPGGVGVFEAVAIAILGNQLPSGLVISGVALYRLISTLAEALGAGLIWLEERIAEMMTPVAKFRKRLLLLPPARDDMSEAEETAALLDTTPQKTPKVSYVVTPQEQESPQATSAQALTMYGEDSGTDDLDNDLPGEELTETVVEDMAPPVKLDTSEPVLPSFLPQSIKAEGEPTSQSFSPKQSS